MKIGLFSDSWVPNINGVVISIVNQIMAMKKEGHEFVVVVPKLKRSVPFEIEGVNIVELRSVPFPPYPGYNVAWIDNRLKRLINNERFDIVHCHGSFSLGYFAAIASRVQRVPLVNTYHTDLVKYAGYLFPVGQQTGFVKNLVATYIRWFYNKSTVITTPSKTLQHDLKSIGVRPPVYAIPNMLSPIFFKNKPSSSVINEFRQNFYEKYNIPEDHKIILYCGRVSAEKKLDVMLTGFKLIEEQKKKITLVIIGDGPALSFYKKIANSLQLKNVVFVGFVSHTKLPYYYQISEFAVTPSDTETQGLTVTEAMSQSKPVIGVNGGGVIDYIIHEYNGLITEPGDSIAFGKAMIKLIDNPDLIKKYGINAKKSAFKLSPDGFTKRMTKAFENAIDLYNQRK